MNNVDLDGLQTLKYNGIWRIYKGDADITSGPHFHNRETGVKYFPEKGKFYNPKTKQWSDAGNSFSKGFDKALKAKPNLLRKFSGKLPAIGIILDVFDAIRLKKEADKNGIDIWTQWLIENGYIEAPTACEG